MKILTLDATANLASVACADNGIILSGYTSQHTVKSAQELPLLVHKALTACSWRADELDGVAFGCGPGSFTGTRVAASIVQGLAYGAHLFVLPVSSLTALAAWVERNHNPSSNAMILTCLDARMGEISAAIYARDSNGRMRCCKGGEERLLKASEVQVMVRQCVPQNTPLLAVGDGCAVLETNQCMPDYELLVTEVPSLATDIAYLACAEESSAWLVADKAQAVYLRGPDAWKTISQQSPKTPS